MGSQRSAAFGLVGIHVLLSSPIHPISKSGKKKKKKNRAGERNHTMEATEISQKLVDYVTPHGCLFQEGNGLP